MSEIRVIYHGDEPPFPPTDQHPAAARYFVWADGRITAAAPESDGEAADIVGLSLAASIAQADAGVAQRSAEAIAAVAPEGDGDESVSAAREAAERAAAIAVQKAQAAGRLQAYVMDAAQRRFLARLHGTARAAFIALVAKERRHLMAAAESPLMALDVVDGPPTQAEIDAIISPPLPGARSPQEKLADFLRENPDVQALLD